MKAVSFFFAKSSSSFDAEHLELCCCRAAERQQLLQEQGSGVEFLCIDRVDPLKSEEELVQDILVSFDQQLEPEQPTQSEEYEPEEDLDELSNDKTTRRRHERNEEESDSRPCVMIRLLRCSPGRDILAVVARRSVMDPLSLCLFLSDVKLLYEAPLDFTLPQLEMQFDEYQMWKSHSYEANDSWMQQMAFWQTALAKPLPCLELPTDAKVSGSKSQTKRMAMCDIPVDERINDRLRQFALTHHVQPRTILLAAFTILLQRYTGKSDVLVGCHFSSRGHHVEIKNLLGSFENWLPLRLQCADHPSVESFIERVLSALSDAEANPDVPLQELKDQLGVDLLFEASFEVYGNTVDEFSFPLITTRLLRHVLGLEALSRTPAALDNIENCTVSNRLDWQARHGAPVSSSGVQQTPSSTHTDSVPPRTVPDLQRIPSSVESLQGGKTTSMSASAATGSNIGSTFSEATLSIAPSIDDELNLQSPYKSKPVSIGGINLVPIPVSTLSMECDDDLRLVGVASPLMRIAFQYNTELFKLSTIRRMTMHFRCILETVLDCFTSPSSSPSAGQSTQASSTAESVDSSLDLDSAGQKSMMRHYSSSPYGGRAETGTVRRKWRISEIPMMRKDEEELVLEQFNATRVIFSPETRDLLIHQLVERKARMMPEAFAVSLHGGLDTLTYAELDAKANQLANFLLLVGVRPEMPVPVLLNRGKMLYVSWLAILKAGGAIMPMDPKFPRERIRVMIEDAQAQLVITEKCLQDALDSDTFPRKLQVIAIDRDWDRTISLGSTLPPQDSDFESGPLQQDNLAYIIYTSGSTGKPKGVMLEHRAIVNYIHWHIKYYEMTHQDKVFSCAGLAFDAAMADTWPTLAVGGCILPITDPDITIVPSRLLDWIAKERATMGFLTTQLCEMVLEEDKYSPRTNLESLRVLYTGGDRLHFGSRPDAPYMLVNIYGPTENTINSTMTVVPKGLRTPPTIGSPVPNTQCYVLDPDTLLPVPIGVFGELFLAGVQLARGYFQLEALSAEKFIKSPFPFGGPRLYKTGDLVRWLENGEIEFQGRKDTQVKIRGNRVELTAIESVLLDHPALRDVVVIAREDKPGQKRLVAYVVLLQDQETDGIQEKLRTWVKNRLPLFMVPSAFVLMDSLPLTPNHKIDRTALPAPTTTRPPPKKPKVRSSSLSNIKLQLSAKNDSNAAALPLMVKMHSVFADVLGVDESQLNEEETHFFEAGGDSLSAGRVTAQVSRLVGMDLPVSLLYKFPTIEKYAHAVLLTQNASGGTFRGDILHVKSLDIPFSGTSETEDICNAPKAVNPLQASFNEESLWLVCQRTDTFASQAYNVPFACSTADPSAFLDPTQLEKSIQVVCSKNESLRTVYREPSDSAPGAEDDFLIVERHILPSIKVDFDHSTVFPAASTSQDVKDWLEKETYKAFDFANGPLFRARLAYHVDENGNRQRQYFLLVVHHIILDLWSLVLLLDRIFGTYYAGAKYTSDFDGTCTYTDYIKYQRNFVATKRCSHMVEFWKANLSGYSAQLELPISKPRPARKSFRGSACLFRLDKSASSALHAISQNTGFTMNVILLTAFKILLRVYTGSSKVHVGVPSAGRSSEDLETVFGYFVNPVVFGADLSGNPTLIQLFHRISMSVLNGLDNQGVPFPFLVDQLMKSAKKGSAGGNAVSGSGGSENPLFNVAYVLQRPFLEREGLAEAMLGFDDVPLRLNPRRKDLSSKSSFVSLATPHRHAQFDLTLMVCFENGQVSGSVQFNTDVFDNVFGDRLSQHFVNLLERIAASQPEKTRLSELSLLGADELQRVTVDFNSVHLDIPDDIRASCVHGLVSKQALETPDATCVEFEDHRLTYGELEERSNRLANFLRFTGVKMEMLVPVLLHRGIDLVVAWLGVLKAGGVIMPMDPKYPPERVRVMLEDAQSISIITQASLKESIPGSFSGRVILIDQDWEDAISLASSKPSPASTSQRPGTLAYAIYTSGSTGKPKGVMLEHRSLVNYISWHIDYYNMSRNDRVFACAGLAFDASIADTWPTLAVGACLLPVTDPDISVVPHRLLDWMIEKKASMGFLTTQICEMVLEEDASNPRPKLGDHLRLLYTGGDRLHFGPRADAPYELVNIYGPTENTVNSSMTYVEKGLKTPPLIGKPAPNTQCFVLDPEYMAPVPIGIYGELFLSGVQLARGYFRQPELTADKFIPNPGFEKGTDKLYRTGDLVRWTSDGQLEFLGRKDTQVKIRGNRIELTAIESTLLDHRKVKECVVVARSDGNDVRPGAIVDKVLVAYFIAQPGASKEEVSSASLKAYLKERLPNFMVPSAFVQLSEFPLTSNHKIDRNALPAPAQGKRSTSSSASSARTLPSTEGEKGHQHSAVPSSTSSALPSQFQSSTEKAIYEIFATILGRDEGSIAAESDFFEEGGHSLSAARIMSKVRQTFGIDMPLSKFLQNPTIRGVTRFVDNSLKSNATRLDGSSSSSAAARSEMRDSLSELTSGNLNDSIATSFVGSSGSKLRLAASSVVSSSYRDSAISEWLQDKRSAEGKQLGTSHDSSTGSTGVSGSLSSSTFLRKIRGKPMLAPMSSLSSSPRSLMLAHSPLWVGSVPAVPPPRVLRSASDRTSPLAASKPSPPTVLSYNQQSLWFLHKVNPKRVDFVVHLCCRIDSASFSPASFEKAVQRLVDRHESLRTIFGEEHGAPFQVVYPPFTPTGVNGATDILDEEDEEDAAKEDQTGDEDRSVRRKRRLPNQVDFLFDTKPQADGMALTETLHKELHMPWDLKQEAPFRVRLYVTDSGKYVFLMTAHHIVVDGWSLDVLLEELGNLYDAAESGRQDDDLPKMNGYLTVREYAKLQKEEMSAAPGTRLWNFWQRQLAGHETNLGLPTDYERVRLDKEPVENGAWFHFELPRDSLQQLQTVIKLERATLFMALLAFYSGLLYRYTGKEDILIGTPMACRTIPELDRTVGNITNLVVLRMHVGKEDNFRSLLRQARAVVLSAFEHQELPFPILVERMSSYRQTHTSPVFQVLLSLNQSFVSELSEAVGPSGEPLLPPSLARLEAGESVQCGQGLALSAFRGVKEMSLEQSTSPYDIQLIFSKGAPRKGEDGEVLESPLFGAIQYKSNLFHPSTIERMASHLVRLIQGSVEHNRLYIEMPILSEPEKETILKDWNSTKVDFPADVCIHQLVEKQAAARPFSTAVSMRGVAWTYFELNSRANILARYLRVKSRVEPGCRVGILLERSPAMILAMLAVAKSGGAYVPMDVAWPLERLSYVFEDSNMTAVLADRTAVHVLRTLLAKRKAREGTVAGPSEHLDDKEDQPFPAIIQLDKHWDKISNRVFKLYSKDEAVENLPPPASSSWGREDQQWHGSRSLVYMIYTSGSTGNPKGVLVEHRSLVNVTLWHQSAYQITHRDRASQLVGSAFDPVGLEVWPFLAAGASVHIVESHVRSDLATLSNWLHHQRVSVTLMPTPLLEVFLRLRSQDWPTSLRVLYGGGDKLHVPAEVLKRVPFRLDNHYGPSEGTIMCTFFIVNDLVKAENDGGVVSENAVLSPSIGKPLHNFAVFVLDEALEPVPILVAGELCIAGPGLARGYHRRPDLTAAKFVEIPEKLVPYLRAAGFEEPVFGTKMYRTGDRVRFKQDGGIEFIGRVDFQVKIRGMRVELGEIESVIKQHPLVVEACVIVREDKPGQQRLCAYVVLRTDADGSESEYSEVERVHALQGMVKDKLPAHMVPAAWIFMEQLPLTQNGKVDRKALPPPSDRVSATSGIAMSAVVNPRSAEELIISELWKETLGLETVSIHDNFFDLGGHSLAATQLLSLVRDTFNVEISIGRFFADPSIAGMASAVAARAAKSPGAEEGTDNGARSDGGRESRDRVSSHGTADWPGEGVVEKDHQLADELGFDPDIEIRLDEDIVPPVQRNGDSREEEQPVSGDDWKVAFITGATGFLGSFFLKSLHDHLLHHRPHASMICLVRGRDSVSAVEHLRRSLAKMDLLEDLEESIFHFEGSELDSGRTSRSNHEETRETLQSRSLSRSPTFLAPRIYVVPGDLGLPMFGLGKTTFQRIANATDIVFHLGAYVHSLFPYSRLKAANVGGTKEVLRLACQRPGFPAMVVHVSTLSVYAPSKQACAGQDEVEVEEEDSLADVGELGHLEGYAQTKWVAEHLVMEAHRRGLPTVILRPGRITGHSETGMANFSDFMYLFLKGCLQLQAAPELNWVMDMNPVDYVCDTLIVLGTKFDRPGQELVGRSFNVCNPDPVYLPAYFEWVANFGYKCPLLPYEEWRKRLIEASKTAGPSRDSRAVISGETFETGVQAVPEGSPLSTSASSNNSSASSQTKTPRERLGSTSRSQVAYPPVAPSRGYQSSGPSSIQSSGSIAISNARSISSLSDKGTGMPVGSRTSTPRLSGGLQRLRMSSTVNRGDKFSPVQESDEESVGRVIVNAEDGQHDGNTNVNALYPLLPMFAPEAAAMNQPVRIKFHCTKLLNREYPSYEVMNEVYFERMIQLEFLPPPPKDNELFTFE